MKQMKLWMLAAILTCGLATTSCSDDDSDSPVQPADEIEEQLQTMTLREKVGQMFYVRPEALDTKDFVEAFNAVITAVENGTITEERINQSVRRILRLKMQRER